MFSVINNLLFRKLLYGLTVAVDVCMLVSAAC